MSRELAILDLVEGYLERDVLVPPACSQAFLEMFSPVEQLLLMSRAVQIAVHLSNKEGAPCPLPIAL